MNRWALLSLVLTACSSATPAASDPADAREPSGASPSTGDGAPNGCPATLPAAGTSCTLPATPEGPFCSYPQTASTAGTSPGERVCSCDDGRWLCFDKPGSEPATP